MTPPRLLLIACSGQVGWELCRTLAPLAEVDAVDFPDIDLTQPDSIQAHIDRAQPAIIVNAAAYTAVDKAEESLDLVKKQYEGGSATVTRYLEAELDRNQARIRVIVARYDREKARAEVGRAIGYWHQPLGTQEDTPQP